MSNTDELHFYSIRVSSDSISPRLCIEFTEFPSMFADGNLHTLEISIELDCSTSELRRFASNLTSADMQVVRISLSDRQMKSLVLQIHKYWEDPKLIEGNGEEPRIGGGYKYK